MSPSKYMWTQNTWCPAMWWRFAGYLHLLEKLTRMTKNFPTVTPISNCQIIHQLAGTCQQRRCCWEETSHEDETTAGTRTEHWPGGFWASQSARVMMQPGFQACFCIFSSKSCQETRTTLASSVHVWIHLSSSSHFNYCPFPYRVHSCAFFLDYLWFLLAVWPSTGLLNF